MTYEISERVIKVTERLKGIFYSKYYKKKKNYNDCDKRNRV